LNGKKYFIGAWGCLFMCSRGKFGSFSKVQASGQVLASERGQGTMEYLVIIAIVVVLSLVVVGVVITQTQSGANVSSTASEIGSKTGLISVTSASLNSQTGHYFLGIKNNDSDAIMVISVLVGSDSNLFAQSLSMTSEKVFKVFTRSGCTEGQKVSANVTISYTTINGLTKTQVLNNLGIDCENVNVDAAKLADYNTSNVGVSDVTAPSIALSSPDENAPIDYADSNVSFVFSFTDASSVSDCNLYIDNVLVDENNSLMVNEELITLDGNLASFGEGDHYWDVNCSDAFGNIGSATDWNINYTIPYVSQFRNVYFGTNSSVREKISICDNVVVGLNAGVVKNITESGIYVGVPAKKIK